MKTVYIHIGLGKTGSSFLQSVFACNAELYRERGLIYPDLNNDCSVAAKGDTTCGNAVPIAAFALPGHFQCERPIAPDDLPDYLDAGFDHLLSSEWLGGCSNDYLESLERMLSPRFNVRFIAVVRNASDHIASGYLEGLKRGLYKDSVGLYVDAMIAKIRRQYRLVAGLGESVHVINYDVHKDDLVRCFDEILFSRHVSASAAYGRVNPSPDACQAMILRLVSCLGLSSHSKARRYLEGAQGHHRPRYALPHQVSERILTELADEAGKINKLLPESEPLHLHMHRTQEEQTDLLTSHDVEFLSGLVQHQIAAEKNADLMFIAEWADRANQLNRAELPEGFNVVSYLVFNPDLVAARVDPIEHYLTYGASEGRRYR